MQFAKGARTALFLLSLVCASTEGHAFSLLGPYAPWMDTTNGYRAENDVGGPVPIGQGYRWNVPVVTYGFDTSFIEYFGSNGVAAVESAISMMNAVPPASSIIVTNYPSYPLRYNYLAQAQLLFDLKTATLILLLEQMGLGAPVRNIFDLVRDDPGFYRHADELGWPPGTIPNLILERNYDPETFSPSHYVNGFLYSGVVDSFPQWADVFEFPVNDLDPLQAAVADLQSQFDIGGLAPALTGDDAAGLRYLLSSNHIAFEALLPATVGAGTNALNFVNLAPRPGVEKVTFVPHPVNPISGNFVAMTNQFTDTYITNGSPMHQQLARTILQPDLLFCSADIGATNYQRNHYVRTGTENWWNSASTLGNTNALGPGVIRPQIKVTLKRRGTYLQTGDDYQVFPPDYPAWGSFDSSTNPPIVYPLSASFSGSDQLTISLWLSQGRLVDAPNFTWQLPVPLGGQATLLTSTNLVDWTQVITVTNRGGAVEWVHECKVPVRFFRVQAN